ncbi:MAG: FAD-dependent oxidoreductase, partial [Cyanobacteria bacterium]|nr:FAD-dependent oxidoreductase [Cyanobacteria bacterium bin.275]
MVESAATPVTAPVVIVGGGFGGLYTALALAGRRQHPPILLIDPNDRFLFLPLLYELLSGELRSWEIAPRYDTLLAGKGVAWLQDRVVRIDSDNGLIHTGAGRQLAFSRLVLATGAQANSFGIP